MASKNLTVAEQGATCLSSRMIFLALETFSLVGGLQNFNRRLIKHLGAEARRRGELTPKALILRDRCEDIPIVPNVEIETFGASRVALLARTAALSWRHASLLIIGHINLIPVAVLARCINPRLPILLIVHGDEVWNDPNFRLMHWWEPHVLKAINLVASVSNFTALQMAKEFNVPSSKFRRMPNAVDQFERVLDRQHTGIPTILTVTRFGIGDRAKNVDKVIQAVAQLKLEFPSIRYEIIGNGSLRPELEMLARSLGVHDEVRFLGSVSDEERTAAYARADIFALPSSKEGFGIVFLEAWQHELPVICSTEGASSEIVEDGVDGFAVNPHDVSQLVDKLRVLLLNRSLATTLGRNGAHKVGNRYVDTKFGDNFRNIIEELVPSCSIGVGDS